MPTQSAHSYQQQEASQNHGEVDCVLDRGILHSPEEALEESGPVFANEPDHNRLKVMADIDLSAHTATETLGRPWPKPMMVLSTIGFGIFGRAVREK